MCIRDSSYTTGLSAEVSANMLRMAIPSPGIIDRDDLALPVRNSDMVLPCGTTARWHR